MLHSVLIVVHLFCAASIIALVLVQRGKGADAGAGFGAGASGTVFGARGAGTALSRATAFLAALFMITSLSLAYMGSRVPAGSTSVLDQLAEEPDAGATLEQLPVAPPVSEPAVPEAAPAP